MSSLQRIVGAGSAFALLLLLLIAPQAAAQSGHDHGPQKNEAVVDEPDVVVHVEGLSCEMCARSVTNALRKIDAVEAVQVLLEDDQRILIALKKGARADEKALREAVSSAGFSTREVVFAAAEKKKGASSR